MSEERTQIKDSYHYDERKRELTINRSHELSNPDTKNVVGVRHNKDVLSESGIREMYKELNSQLNTYRQQSKVMVEQLEKMKETEVDEEFLKKLEAVQAMKSKQQTLEQLKGADVAIKEIQRQLNDLKSAVGSRLKW